MPKICRPAVVCVGSLSLAAAAMASVPRFTLSIVGPASSGGLEPGAIASWPMGMNNNARVVGYETVSAGQPRALSWRDGQPQLLPGLSAFPRTYASRVNIRGEIVGAGYDTNEAGAITSARALLWIGSATTDLGGLGGTQSAALAINDDRTVVGYSTVAGSSRIGAWVWRAGTLSELNTLPSATQAFPYDISPTGTIVGAATVSGTTRPWVHSGGSTVELPLPVGTRTGTANAVNAAGVVVGGYETNRLTGEFVASIWQNGARQDLGSLGTSWRYSLAHDVNISGQVVGVSSIGSTMTGFLWQNGSMFDLRELVDAPGLNAQIVGARAINDRGQIAATARIDAREFAVLLTPVPTPGSAAVVALAAIATLRRRRR